MNTHHIIMKHKHTTNVCFQSISFTKNIFYLLTQEKRPVPSQGPAAGTINVFRDL